MRHILEQKKLKLDEEKKKLLLKAQLLQEQEKKKRVKRFQEIGRLAYKANIDHLSSEALLGVFLEIAENSQQEASIQKWQTRAQAFLKTRSEENSTPLAIKFKAEVSKKIADQLRELNFKWNRFRKEYYGYGNKSQLTHLLDGANCHIQEVLD